jgi:Pyruvate/2-oxoacid:ferredoxin oxidoreductase delta subunit
MLFKEVLIYFTSGTGNSYRVAKFLEQFANQKGAKARVVPIEQSDPGSEIRDNEDSALGVVMPTHAFTAPWHMIKFALRLPQKKSTRAFCIATRAGLKAGPVFTPGISGSGTFLIALILAIKGYKLLGVMSVDMPSNWISLHPGLGKKSSEAIIARARSQVSGFAGSVFSGGKVWWTVNNLYELLWGILLLPLSLGFLLMGRFFLAKLFFANNNCNSCGICADNCPVHAVKMYGKKKPWPFWSYHCESCMRCMNYCPKRAIEAGHSWAVVLYFLTSSAVFTYLISSLAGLVPGIAELKGYWVENLLYLLYFYPALFISYYLFYLVTRVPALNAVFTYTTFTHIYRRYHEPETRVRELSTKSGQNERQ